MSQPGDPKEAAPGGRRSWADLGPRLVSGVVLIAVAIIALYFGGYLFAAVTGVAFAGAYREWDTMVTLKPLSSLSVFLIALVFLGAILFPLWGGAATLAVAALGGAVALVRGGEGAVWRAGGQVYFGIVTIAMLTLRGSDATGIWAGAFLGATIWLTDTGAFFTGRQVGGEKLAPDISPAKTWSGAIGGLVLGTIAGTLIWHFATSSPLWLGVLLSAGTSIVGQAGDLFESALKRRFRIKDSGNIIPGHGGLMDRLDSVTFGVLFLFIVGVLHTGPATLAAGVLHW